MPKIVLQVITLFKCSESFGKEIFTSLLASENKEILQNVSQILPTVFCALSAASMNMVEWNEKENDINVTVICEDCWCRHFDIAVEDRLDKIRLIYSGIKNASNTIFASCGATAYSENVKNEISKCSIKLYSNNDATIKINMVKTLTSLCWHIPQFHSSNMMQLWMTLVGDENESVRRAFTDVIATVIQYILVSIF